MIWYSEINQRKKGNCSHYQENNILKLENCFFHLIYFLKCLLQYLLHFKHLICWPVRMSSAAQVPVLKRMSTHSQMPFWGTTDSDPIPSIPPLFEPVSLRCLHAPSLSISLSFCRPDIFPPRKLCQSPLPSGWKAFFLGGRRFRCFKNDLIF